MADAVHRVRRAQPWLGTLVEIAAEGASLRQVDDGVDAAFAAIARVHAALSAHDDSSELVRVNRGAAHVPIVVSEDFRRVLACALDVAARSGGVFDPAVGDSLAAWGFVPRAANALSRGHWRDVILDGTTVRFNRPVALDFGGIAKGYAVDCAIDALVAAGIAQACVNAGGDLRVRGARAETVHVRTGGAQSMLVPIAGVADAAIATSAFGGQRRALGGRYVTPLVDPRTRMPVMSTRTVSVIAPTCMLADALTKVVALRGARAGSVLAGYGAEASVLSPAHGRWRITRLPGVRTTRRAA